MVDNKLIKSFPINTDLSSSSNNHDASIPSTCAGPRSLSNKLLLSAGRPPWYDAGGKQQQALIIGVCGGSASGKTTLSRSIIKKINVPWVVILSLDSFYRDLNDEEVYAVSQGLYNFDSPNALDMTLAAETLKNLKEGKKVQVPIYDFKTHKRLKQASTVYGANVVIFEGILAFHDQRILDLMDLKIFVDTDCDLRLARRLTRDVLDRGRSLDDIIPQYLTYVKPCFDQLIAPTMKRSDLVVSWNSINQPALNLISSHVLRELQRRGFVFRSTLVQCDVKGDFPLQNVHILPQSNQVVWIQTIIRDHRCSRDDFVFYSQRLMRIVFTTALSLFPYKESQVTTHSGKMYDGKEFNFSNVCGVSIMRAGECFEDALSDVCQDVKIGKILIQTNPQTGEPELFYCSLPSNIEDCHVFLMDATIASGAAALMAIRILLDHGVKENNVILTTLITTKYGVRTINSAFPHIRIVSAACDEELNDEFHIIPGIGNFGNRYFGTD